MPSIVGTVNINSNSGSINFGDALNVSPNNVSKTYTGSGSSNTGNLINTNNGISLTNTLDPDVADQTQTGSL